MYHERAPCQHQSCSTNCQIQTRVRIKLGAQTIGRRVPTQTHLFNDFLAAQATGQPGNRASYSQNHYKAPSFSNMPTWALNFLSNKPIPGHLNSLVISQPGHLSSVVVCPPGHLNSLVMWLPGHLDSVVISLPEHLNSLVNNADLGT